VNTFLGRHLPKIAGPTVVAVFILSAFASEDLPVSLSFDGHGIEKLAPGGVAALDLIITAKTPINALEATIAYPDNLLEIFDVTRNEDTFSLWPHSETHDPAVNLRELHVVAGTVRRGGFVGTSTIATLHVRAKSVGSAELSFNSIEVTASDGKGTPVPARAHPFAYTIAERRLSSSGNSASISVAETAPTPDLDRDGSVTIVDVSILLIRIFGPYDRQFDLDRDGALGISDLSAILARLGR
jgi:hypothetical protein